MPIHDLYEFTGCITSITPTICSLMGINPPAHASRDCIDALLKEKARLNIDRVEKILVYAPDAIGIYLYHDYRDSFAPLLGSAPIEVALKAVYPSYTPVCFASMFCGSQPDIHGIKKYEKPVVRCDTLFDMLARSGRKVAIVAVENSSIDIIFRNREIDYFTEKYDSEVTARTLELVESGRHDFILAYNQEYDDIIHKDDHRSPVALRAMHNHINTAKLLAESVEKNWRGHSRLFAVTPDHGTHLESQTGKGNHGTDMPEDMCVMHFFNMSNA